MTQKTFHDTLRSTRQFEHYIKFSYNSGRRVYYPIITAGVKRFVRRKRGFRCARDAKKFALRFNAKLAAGAFAPGPQDIPAPEPEPLTWWQRLLAWLKSLVWRPA